ncbi:MAG: DUF2461 domain-containing protein [Bacteroidales bacterium]|nr:DUF2461 domain-containing protein [Bacteroidales bacterium]
MTYSEYLSLLAANNNRQWFHANRPLFDEMRDRWYADLDRLFAAMSAYELSARYADGKTASYRIYRDTRFSPDKTPYKTYFSAELTPRGRHVHGAGWYMQAGVTRGQSGFYGGLWSPDAAQLRKMRHAIVDNIEEFEQIMADPLLRSLYPEWWGPQLKTIPKGWPRDHQQAPLLRLLHYGREHAVDPTFFDDPEWPSRAAEIMRPLKPLIDFIDYSIFEE